MTSILDKYEPMLQQLEAQEQAEAEAAEATANNPVTAKEYLGDHQQYLAELGLPWTPEVESLLDRELSQLYRKHQAQVAQERQQARDARLKAELDEAIRTRSQTNSADRARLAVDFGKQGLGRPVTVGLRDREVWERVAEEVEPMVKRIAGQIETKSKQQRLYEQYQQEIKAIPPHANRAKAVTQLHSKYRAMGLNFEQVQPPAPKRPKLSEQEKEALTIAYQAEVAKWRGSIRHVTAIQIKYRKLGLNI